MNKKAVKQLTKKGCIVAKDAAESLSEEDIEQIESLDSAPMYITEEMLDSLRQSWEGNGQGDKSENERPDIEPEAKNTDEEDSEELDKVLGEPNNDLDEEEDSQGREIIQNPVRLEDTGSRNDLRTKVEILEEADISKDEKDVPEFLQYYNDRYDRAKKLLMRRRELQSAISIGRLERRDEGEEAAAIGLVKNKYSTSTGKYIIELEDKTDTFKVLADDRQGERIVPDEVIGVTGRMGGDIIYADSIVRPDMPIPDGVNTTEEKVRAAYISDLHIGSQDTLHDRLDTFADWLGSEQAKEVGYLVMPGDMVEGVGVYPGQDEHLIHTDVYKQYGVFEDWIDRIPEDIQIIIGPGNHDVVRLAEPQPRIPEKAFDRIHDYNNVHLVQNPQNVRLHGIESEGLNHLLYHGMSFDDHVDQIQDLREKAYDDPHHVMIDLLKRRHLAPTYGSNQLSPEGKDHLLIEQEPDVMVSGHFHSHDVHSYKGVHTICASTFQAQTDFQKRVGHEPQPGRVTLMNFKNRKTEVKRF